jgi:hypothetical protein
MKKLLVVLAAVAVVMAIGAGTALATKPNPAHKVTICHATPPDTAANGYVQLSVDVASVGYQHSGHETEHDADIIPPYEYTAADGNTFSYPGKNFGAGQAILNNGCVVPDTTPPPPSSNPSGSIAVGTCDNQDSTAFLDNSDSNVDVTFTVNGSDYVVGAGETQTADLGAVEGTITVTVGQTTVASDSVSYAQCEVPTPPPSPSPSESSPPTSPGTARVPTTRPSHHKTTPSGSDPMPSHHKTTTKGSDPTPKAPVAKPKPGSAKVAG